MIDTTDGALLRIVPPFKITISNIEKSDYATDALDYFYFLFEEATELQFRKRVFSCEKDALQRLIFEIQDYFQWISDERRAPPSNEKEWSEKALISLENLREKYSDYYPEVFI